MWQVENLVSQITFFRHTRAHQDSRETKRDCRRRCRAAADIKTDNKSKKHLQTRHEMLLLIERVLRVKASKSQVQ